jgi:hypothetical protein
MPAPRSILLIKGHSAGIGDLLRNSAAWRALHDHFPGARLGLWFLSRDSGAASEHLIRQHRLLEGFYVTDKRLRPGGWREIWRDARAVVAESPPNLIVDCEAKGFRTSLLAWRLGR